VLSSGRVAWASIFGAPAAASVWRRTILRALCPDGRRNTWLVAHRLSPREPSLVRRARTATQPSSPMIASIAQIITCIVQALRCKWTLGRFRVRKAPNDNRFRKPKSVNVAANPYDRTKAGHLALFGPSTGSQETASAFPAYAYTHKFLRIGARLAGGETSHGDTEARSRAEKNDTKTRRGRRARQRRG
jgi:hypothetical protein